MKKRFLSIFLALVMCLTLLPTMALAKSYRTYYVDDDSGSDSYTQEFDGGNYAGDSDHPLKTIAKALEKAGSGDITFAGIAPNTGANCLYRISIKTCQ